MLTDIPDSVSHHKARASASVRKARKRVRVRETLQQEQERMLNNIIRESDVIAGFDRFHKRSATLQEIAIFQPV